MFLVSAAESKGLSKIWLDMFVSFRVFKLMDKFVSLLKFTCHELLFELLLLLLILCMLLLFIVLLLDDHLCCTVVADVVFGVDEDVAVRFELPLRIPGWLSLLLVEEFNGWIFVKLELNVWCSGMRTDPVNEIEITDNQIYVNICSLNFFILLKIVLPQYLVRFCP